MPRIATNRARRSGGKHSSREVVFPVYFETDLFSCKLVSKYEVVTVYLDNTHPIISHQKREKEYVVEYRLYLNDAFNREISQQEFECRYSTAQQIGRVMLGLNDSPCTIANRPRVVLTNVRSAVLVEIQRIDRFKYLMSLDLRVYLDDTNYITQEAVEVEVTINRYGEIRWARLQLDDYYVFAYGEYDSVGLAGFIHFMEPADVIVDKALGEVLTWRATGANVLNTYNLAGLQGGDFNDDFNNDFDVIEIGVDGDYNIDFNNDFSQ